MNEMLTINPALLPQQEGEICYEYLYETRSNDGSYRHQCIHEIWGHADAADACKVLVVSSYHELFFDTPVTKAVSKRGWEQHAP
jgi:hypothetical protein